MGASIRVTTTERGLFSMVNDGTTYHMEHEVTSFDDWRDTPFGLVNFGKVVWGPWRTVRSVPS